MATFVLVHGSFCGGWVWQKLTPLLRAAGHEVYTLTLTGLSDRAHLLECGVNLTTHVRDVASLIEYEDLSDVILVGNSYAGMVITGVAATLPERLRLLVFLDAYLPDAGQTELDLWPEEMRVAILAEKGADRELRPPPPAAWFGVTDPDMADWLSARLSPQPMATYTEPVPDVNAESGALPSVYVHCTGGPTTTLFATFAAKARSKGWPVHELATGHLAMLTAPGPLAEVLLKFTM